MAEFTPVTLVKGDVERVVTSAVEHTRLTFSGFTEKAEAPVVEVEADPVEPVVEEPLPRPGAAQWRPAPLPRPQATGRL